MEDRIFITDDNGNEVEMRIVFTFHHPENEKDYCVVTENDDDYYAFEYDNDGHLIEVEDQEILDSIQELLDDLDLEAE